MKHQPLAANDRVQILTFGRGTKRSGGRSKGRPAAQEARPVQAPGVQTWLSAGHLYWISLSVFPEGLGGWEKGGGKGKGEWCGSNFQSGIQDFAFETAGGIGTSGMEGEGEKQRGKGEEET